MKRSINSIIFIVLGVLLTMVQPALAVEVPSREWCKNQLAEQAAETPTELECIKRYGDKIAGTAKAKSTRADEEVWWTDCRHGWITKEFKGQDDFPVEIIDTSVRITYDELRKLMKDLPRITRALKACDAYRKCLDDRDAGKIKHCYANDRRWREYITGAW